MANEANSDNPLGKRFRNAREALGLSVSEVAERLHIIPKYVRCIESNEYSQLPGVVFLKGYIRSYARLLGLPEDQVVSQLEEALTASGSYVESADRFAALPPPPREGLGTALLFLAVLMLAAGAGWYWLQRAPLEPALSAGSGAAGSGAAGSGAAGSGAAGSGAAGPGTAGPGTAGSERAAAINRALLRRGVIVRPLEPYGMGDWLRISVGLTEENQVFLDVLAEIFAGTRASGA